MGNAASVKIWVGLNGDRMDLEAIAAALFSGFDAGDDYDRQELLCEVSEELCIEHIRAGEEDDGLGIEVYEHDWNDGITVFDMADLSKKIEAAKAKLQALFEKNGIIETIDVWTQTDFS